MRFAKVLVTVGFLNIVTGCGAPIAQSCQSLANTMKESEPEISEISNLTEVKRSLSLVVCKGDAVNNTGNRLSFEVDYSLTKSDGAGREYTTSWEFK